VEDLHEDPKEVTPDEQDLERTYRQYTQGAPDGGRSTRGPLVHPGGDNEPQGPVPPYEGRKEHADTLDAPSPPQAGEENVLGAAGIRQTTEPPPGEPPESREQELNENTGTDASAEEIKNRIDTEGANLDRGASEGEPDPVTNENVHATEEDSRGRPRGGAPGS
jgi:hypothetical protein